MPVKAPLAEAVIGGSHVTALCSKRYRMKFFCISLRIMFSVGKSIRIVP